MTCHHIDVYPVRNPVHVRSTSPATICNPEHKWQIPPTECTAQKSPLPRFNELNHHWTGLPASNLRPRCQCINCLLSRPQWLCRTPHLSPLCERGGKDPRVNGRGHFPPYCVDFVQLRGRRSENVLRCECEFITSWAAIYISAHTE